MSRSRGKGARRGPWRDGGAKKRRQIQWRKRAPHASPDVSTLGKEVLTLSLLADDRPEGCIYKFDQLAARHGLAYHAELVEASTHSTLFDITVALTQESLASKLIVLCRGRRY